MNNITFYNNHLTCQITPDRFYLIRETVCKSYGEDIFKLFDDYNHIRINGWMEADTQIALAQFEYNWDEICEKYSIPYDISNFILDRGSIISYENCQIIIDKCGKDIEKISNPLYNILISTINYQTNLKKELE